MLLAMHPQMPLSSQTKRFERQHCFHLYSEDQPQNGMRTTWPTILPGRMSEHISPLNFQTDETNFDSEWMWNIVSEDMENKFENFATNQTNGWRGLARWYEQYWGRSTKCRRRCSRTTKKTEINRLSTKTITT